jgi:KUP system potassium uptake protein
VEQIIPGILIRIDFHIGFKVEPKINLYFKEALEDLVQSGEIILKSSYDSLKKHDFPGDFKFILIERIMIRDFKLSNWENFILTLNRIAQVISLPEMRTLKLDSTITMTERVPIIIHQTVPKRIKRI